jgi:hypothetical protein
MMTPKDLGLFSGPAMQKSTFRLILGIHVLLAGIIWLLLSHEDYSWAIIVGGAVIGFSGAFKVSAPEGKDV